MFESDCGFGKVGDSIVAAAAKTTKLQPRGPAHINLADTGLPGGAPALLTGAITARQTTRGPAPTEPTERGEFIKNAIDEFIRDIERACVSARSLKSDASGNVDVRDAGFGKPGAVLRKAKKASRDLKPLDTVALCGNSGCQGRILRTRADGKHTVQWSAGDTSIHSADQLELCEVSDSDSEKKNPLVTSQVIRSGPARVSPAPMALAAKADGGMADSGL